MFWPDLIKIALLGTERSPVPEDDRFPEPVRAVLSQTGKTDPETRLLRASALMYTWQRSGQKAPQVELPELPTAPPETRPFCPPAYSALLKKILANPVFYGPITGYLLRHIHQKQLVVPYEHLVSLMALGVDAAFKKHKTVIAGMMGTRGTWLAQQNPLWHPLLETDKAQVWEEGSAAERKQYLIALRSTDPQQSAALVENAWPKANVRERKEWLTIMATETHPAELAFVEQLWASLQAEPEPVRPLQLELKQLAATLLLGAPDAALFQNYVGRLTPYFQRQSGLMGLQAKVKINLPKGYDAFFHPDQMAGTLGLDKNSPFINCSEAEYWLSELVGLLHPKAWESLIDPDWNKIVDFFASVSVNTEKKQWPLLQNLSRALSQSQYLPGINAYVQKYPVNAANFTMLRALSNDALEAWFRQQPNLEQAGLVRTVLDRSGWVWSYALSKQILQSLIKEDNISHNAEFAKSVCLHFHPGIMADLEAFQQHETLRWQQHQIQKLLIGPLLRLLQLRAEIDRLKE